MKYASVCSGIEAATAAWHPLGWKPVFFAEIEKFPCAVLAHHYPDVPNLGDITKFKDWPDADFDVLVGGTPCQSFSVAGLRKGLDDPRGNLMLTYGAIAGRYRPEWLVWENVPGVLSSNGGRDFGSFLGMLGQLGYGFAYRVLDAQYFGVPQRRRRVFVVGHIGDWRRAAAVLFERHSLQGHIAPRREARESVAGTFTSGSSKSGGWGNKPDLAAAGYMIPVTPSYGIKTANTSSNGRGICEELAYTLDQAGPSSVGVPAFPVRGPEEDQGLIVGTLTGGKSCGGHGRFTSADAAAQGFLIAHPLSAPYDSTEDGTGRGVPLVSCALLARQSSSHHAATETFIPEIVSQAMSAKWAKGSAGPAGDEHHNLVAVSQPASPVAFQSWASHTNSMNPSTAVAPTLDKGKCAGVAIAFAENSRAEVRLENGDGQCTGALSTGGGKPGQGAPTIAYTTKLHNTGSNNAGKFFEERTASLDANSPAPALITTMAVRRLTPLECERLQGFEDNYTRIPMRFYRQRKITKLRPEDLWEEANGGWWLMAADSPRYKAIGNSMAETVMAWIGRRIAEVEAL